MIQIKKGSLSSECKKKSREKNLNYDNCLPMQVSTILFSNLDLSTLNSMSLCNRYFNNLSKYDIYWKKAFSLVYEKIHNNCSEHMHVTENYSSMCNFKEKLRSLALREKTLLDISKYKLLNLNRLDHVMKMKIYNENILICVCWNMFIHIFSLLTGDMLIEIQTSHGGYIPRILVTKYGILTCCLTGKVSLTKIIYENKKYKSSYEELFTHDNKVTSMEFNKNILVTVSEDMTSIIYDLETNRIIRMIHLNFKLRCVDFNGNYIVYGGLTRNVFIYDLFGTLKWTLDAEATSVFDLIIGDGYLFIMNSHKIISLWNTKTMEKKYFWEISQNSKTSINQALVIKNNIAYVHNYDFEEIRIICLKNFKIIKSVQCYHNVTEIYSFTISSIYLIIVSNENHITLYNIKTEKYINDKIILDCSFEISDIELISNDGYLVAFLKSRSLIDQNSILVLDLMNV